MQTAVLTPLLAGASSSWELLGSPDAGRFDVHPVDLGGGVIRLQCLQAVEPFYALQLSTRVDRAIPPHHRIQIRFRARSTQRCGLRAVLERAESPWTAVAEVSIGELEPVWREYQVTAVSSGSPPNTLHFGLQFGHRPGIIEITGLEVRDMGLDPVWNAARREVDDAAVQRRIRALRMGTLQVEVRNRAGQPVRQARVQIEMRRHAFWFGCNIFGLNPEDASPEQVAYQRRFSSLFNFATLPFYWGAYEPQPGQTREGPLRMMAAWCREHGIRTKGHPLVWHEVWPQWAPVDPDQARQMLLTRVQTIIDRFRGLVDGWDVINEANSSASFAHTGLGRWVARDGAVAVVRACMQAARDAAGKDAFLVVNDYDMTDAFPTMADQLKRRGGLPDAFGQQSHMHTALWDLERAWVRAQEMGQFARPVHFTELTVLGSRPKVIDYSNPPAAWEVSAETEALQADYVERLYTLLFSHPSVQAITWWDLSDRNAWMNAPAGLIRADMTPKPAYERLMRLIRRNWWTDYTGLTGWNGAVQTRAFYGDYTIRVDGPGILPRETQINFRSGSGYRKVTFVI